MPTYEYTCKSCNENIEVFQSFSEKPLRKHTDCGGDLQKVFHARGVVFKGSGFYATDSRNGSDNSSAPSTSSGDSKTKKGSGDSKGKDKSKPKTPASTSSKSSD